MTFFRTSFGIITRTPKTTKSGKPGKSGSALRRSAYQRCVNEGPYRFAHKANELHSCGIILPDGAMQFASPSDLWTAAEAMEKRVDSQLARTFEIAIPHEVPNELRAEFTHDMLSWLSDQHGFAVEWSRHVAPHVFEDGTVTDTMNDHIHAQVSMRKLGADGFDPKKDREFNTIMRKDDGRHVRRMYADKMNDFFDRHGITAHVTAEKHEDLSKIDEAPKHIIQEIKRAKERKETDGLVQQKLTKGARDFIQKRHSRKAAIKGVRRAAIELEEVKRELREDAHTKEPDSTGNRTNDVSRDRSEANPEPADIGIRKEDRERAPSVPGTTADPTRREERGLGGRTIESHARSSSEPIGPDRSPASLDRDDRPKIGPAPVDLQPLKNAIRAGKIRNAAQNSMGFLDDIREIQNMKKPDLPKKVQPLSRFGRFSRILGIANDIIKEWRHRKQSAELPRFGR